MARAWTFGRKITLGFGFSVLMLLVVGAVGYRSTDTLIENDRLVNHTHQVLEGIAHVLSLMKDAETGQRGFVMTNDEAHLEPYQSALAALPGSVADLRRLT